MKFYSQIQTVSIPHETILKAKTFAEQVAPTTNYKDANQHQLAKIKNDHFISKIGEEAVKIIMSRFVDISEPDYTIYYGKSKSWQEDLFAKGVGISVKTQKKSMANKYGLSWTFQAGPNRKDIVLSKPEAWVVFVEFDDTNPNNLCSVFPPFQIKELTFGEPKLDYLKGHKKVVYAHTLLL